jgi:hypothetical protein
MKNRWQNNIILTHEAEIGSNIYKRINPSFLAYILDIFILPVFKIAMFPSSHDKVNKVSETLTFEATMLKGSAKNYQ